MGHCLTCSTANSLLEVHGEKVFSEVTSINVLLIVTSEEIEALETKDVADQ